MEIAIPQQRFHRMGLSFPLQPFGMPGIPLCDLFRWSDFLGADTGRASCSASGINEFLNAMGLSRVPQLDVDSRDGLAGLVSVVQVPEPAELVPHVLGIIERWVSTSTSQPDPVLALLVRLAGRHPQIAPVLLGSVRRILAMEGTKLKYGMIERCCEVLRRWGDASDLPFLTGFLHGNAPEARLAALWTAYSLGLCGDTGFRGHLESLPPEACDEGAHVKWSDLLTGLEGGELDGWFLLLAHQEWEVRQSAALVMQELALSHPYPESVFEVLRERLLVESDSDIMICLSWALGCCLRRLGTDAAEILIHDVAGLPDGLGSPAGLAVLRALVRLPPDPTIWDRLDPALRALPSLLLLDDEIRRNIAVVERHFDPYDVSPESVACRMREEGGWLADLADPRLQPVGMLAKVLEQQEDPATGLWIALGTKTQTASWIRSWLAARISIHHPELVHAFAAAVIPTAHGRRRQFAAVGCAVSASHVGVDPLYLACALELPVETFLADDVETAVLLISLLDDSGLADNARARLNASGPVVRALWRNRLQTDQMNTYSSDRIGEARSQLFYAGGPLPDPIALVHPGWLEDVGLGTGRRSLECLGAVPGSDPVRRARMLESIEEHQTLRSASVLWAPTLEGARAAWTSLLGRGDWEGREAACTMAMGVSAAFWEGKAGDERLQQLMAYRLDPDSDVSSAATTTCHLLGIEPLPDTQGSIPTHRRRRKR